MPRVGNLWLRAGLACCLASLAGGTPAAPLEYNPVSRHAVSIGPEAGRLIVGFKALPGEAIRQTIIRRARVHVHAVTQAETGAADALALAQRVGLALAHSRQITPSVHVLFLPKTLYGADVAAALAKLRADPSVQFADVDEIRHAHAVMPNDPLFQPTAAASGQWYLDTPSSNPIVLNGIPSMDLSATDAVSAWGITTGSEAIVIADVDTGVRFDHPDLLRAGFGGRLLPGYDFVGQDYDPTNGTALGTFLIANDGDGWDPDPSDPGDWISTSDTMNSLFSSDTAEPSSWHGTRVVGVFGAIANNDVGIAGMTWGPWILPVRALGKGGGYDSDIIAGIEWAAGMPVTNPDGAPVPDNPYPADIINLSLGGSGTCPSDYQSALAQVTQLGVLVVASAGNGGSPGVSAPVEAPANCSVDVPGVVAVVGLRNVGTKVGYSSFGPEASVAAPAGNCVSATSPPCLRSIDTTTNSGTTTPGVDGYTNQDNPNLGTSFSAPIVSGIAALMRSANNNLTPAQLAARLKSSATVFPAGAAGVPTCPTNDPTTGECACPTDGSQCGAGMVNALQAVMAAQKPIAVIAIPANLGAGSVFDASGSVAACNTSLPTPAAFGIATYAWTASPAGIIVSGANSPQVTVNPAPGTLSLTVTDSGGNADTETVTLTANSATSTAPATSGTSSTACPAALKVSVAAPQVAASFSPASVSPNTASTLTITFENANGFALTQSSFSLTLPANLTIPASPAAATTCSGASKSLTNTSTSVTLHGANIPADGNCTITLPVQSTSAGAYTASIAAAALSTAPAGANSAGANASLTVSAPSGGGGGGGRIDWLDIMFVVGVLLAVRRPVSRQMSRSRVSAARNAQLTSRTRR
jgi:serine protease